MALPYRISTITATGSVNTEINLDAFYDVLNICEEQDEFGVIYVEYGKKKSETVYKGFSKKFLINKRKEQTTSKRFDNQVTIVYKMTEPSNSDGTPGPIINNMNIKIFRNGNIQITGIKYIEQGRRMIDIIIKMLKDTYEHDKSIVASIDNMRNVNYNIRLINSDFRIGFPIKREYLYKIFSYNYSNDCTFEPCIYPGVKIQYFYNKQNFRTDGLCHCQKQCEVGKGNGNEDGSCKKITIAVFQSGSIIITGAQSHEQINEAYDFITQVLKEHQNDIEKKVIMPTVEACKKKKYMINKKNIVYPASCV
jgi:TATA-box binding protein (TBP) (component of TFIID and TFIIIB)